MIFVAEWMEIDSGCEVGIAIRNLLHGDICIQFNTKTLRLKSLFYKKG